MEGHEQPYLTGGTQDVIRTGHTFSDEPGVYIEGKVSVVLDDTKVSPTAFLPLGWRAARRLFLYRRGWDWGVPYTERGRTEQITLAALRDKDKVIYINPIRQVLQFTIYKEDVWIFALDMRKQGRVFWNN